MFDRRTKRLVEELIDRKIVLSLRAIYQSKMTIALLDMRKCGFPVVSIMFECACCGQGLAENPRGRLLLQKSTSFGMFLKALIWHCTIRLQRMYAVRTWRLVFPPDRKKLEGRSPKKALLTP